MGYRHYERITRMIIVGEKINTSRKIVADAVRNRDKRFILDLAGVQESAGASYIDINVGTFINTEPEDMAWVVDSISGNVKIPLSIDSPNPKAVAAAMGIVKGPVLINSISLEKERFDNLIPIAQEFKCPVIGLLIEDGNLPADAESRMKVADKLVTRLADKGVAHGSIFIDPMVQPLSTSMNGLNEIFRFTAKFKSSFPGVHLICGLSNVSFGLPNRKLVNRAFLAAMMTLGMDSAICDPLDKELMGLIAAQEALLGKDQFCMNFISLSRSGKI
ncbi:MAG: dihydropteroate synthase [Candidatus Aureabacteria bacterium]|nr:dihydropteroate synthase [Candidatus Auribacterota bacterium]